MTMTKAIRRQFTVANLLSAIALFVVLTSAAYAASSLPKNSVGTKQLKNNAVTSAKIKNNNVTGNDVKESSLGTVPTATVATNANNADTLDAMDSSAFVSTSTFVPFHVAMTAGQADVTVASAGGISIKAKCSNDGSDDYLTFYAATDANGAILESYSYDDADPLDTTTTYDDAEVLSESASQSSEYFSTTYGYPYTVANAARTTYIVGNGDQQWAFNVGGKDCVGFGQVQVRTI
jgi:hypothetical protein